MNPPDYILEFREKFPESYRTLELSGHIPNGSVSEVINWEEIEPYLIKIHDAAVEEGYKRGWNNGSTDSLIIGAAEARGRNQAVDYIKHAPWSPYNVDDMPDEWYGKLQDILESARTIRP